MFLDYSGIKEGSRCNIDPAGNPTEEQFKTEKRKASMEKQDKIGQNFSKSL